LGLPLFLFPGGRHSSTPFGSLPSSILCTCPEHWSCFFYTSSKRDLVTFIFSLIMLLELVFTLPYWHSCYKQKISIEYVCGTRYTVMWNTIYSKSCAVVLKNNNVF
jgi:hypothetical protein